MTTQQSLVLLNSQSSLFKTVTLLPQALPKVQKMRKSKSGNNNRLDLGFTKTFPGMTRNTSIGSLKSEYDRLVKRREKERRNDEIRRTKLYHEEKEAAYRAKVKFRKRERARQYHKLKTNAAITLQARWRSKYYRQKWLQVIFEKQTQATRLIQDVWLMYRLRQHSKGVLAQRKRAFEEWLAATAIEHCYMKYRQRSHAKGIMSALAHKRKEVLRLSILKAQNDASLSIQQVYRGYKGKLLALRQMDIKRERENLERQAEEMKEKINAELRRKGAGSKKKKM